VPLLPPLSTPLVWVLLPQLLLQVLLLLLLALLSALLLLLLLLLRCCHYSLLPLQHLLPLVQLRAPSFTITTRRPLTPPAVY